MIKNQKLILLIIFFASFFVGFFVRLVFSSYNISLENQPVSDAILIKDLVMPKSGFITFSLDKNKEYRGRKVFFGISDYLPAGEYKNLSIQLYPTNQRNDVEQGDGFFAQVYLDNGDKVFNQDTDKVLVIPFLGEYKSHAYFK